MPTRFVNAETLELLELGDAAIRIVRTVVKHGAANQPPQVAASGGLSVPLANRTMAWAQHFAGKPGRTTYDPADWKTWSVSARAVAAARLRAGNCQDQAALVYRWLRYHLPSKYMVSYCQVPGHCFTCIGDPTNADVEIVIVVDPWPIETRAVLWEDYFRSGDAVTVIRKKPAGKQGLYLTNKYPAIPHVADLMADAQTWAGIQAEASAALATAGLGIAVDSCFLRGVPVDYRLRVESSVSAADADLL